MTPRHALPLRTAPTIDLTPYAPRDAPVFTGQASFTGSASFGGPASFAAPARLPDGSAAAPALTFSADGDTGLSRPATDTLAVVGGGTEQFRVAGAPAAVNLMQVSGAASGGAPSLSAQGSDPSVSLALVRKGGGSILLVAPDANPFGVEIADGCTGDRVCYLDFHAHPAADYSLRLLRLPGANGAFYLCNVGSGGVQVRTGPPNGEVLQFAVQHQPAAVNNLAVTGASSGGAPSLAAQGADASVDLALLPKGPDGRLRFGSVTGCADAPVTGYVEIRDASGTLRKLAVIA